MKKVCVKSYGCSANFAEGEMIAGRLSKSCTLTSESDADTVVLNVCTVKGDEKTLREIQRIKESHPKKKLVVTGCVTNSLVNPIRKIDPAANVLNTHHLEKVNDVVQISNATMLSHEKPIKLLHPRVRENKIVGIVPISSGCLDACAFCSTRLVKGALFSYPEEKIVEEVKQCVADGCKEIWITGQDTCCYGFDRNTNLAKLLKQIVAVEGDFLVRIGMGNPRHLPKFKDELIEVFKHPKIFKFVHLPVQAGNNEVLKAMRRGHDVETFVDLVHSFRKEIPDMTISTDIIVGYPTETDEQFQDTLQLVEECELDVINRARFAPRPGTSAATMDGQVHDKVKKERSRLLTEKLKDVAAKRNERWLGWEGEVVIDEHKDGISMGRNFAYKPVVIKKHIPLGTKVKVKVTRTTCWALHTEQ